MYLKNVKIFTTSFTKKNNKPDLSTAIQVQFLVKEQDKT